MLVFLCRASAEETSTPPQTEAPRRARVVIVEDPGATATFEPNREKIVAMLNRGLVALTGKTNLQSAWLSVVSTQDIVGVKVLTAPGPTSGTRRAVVEGVIEGLLASGLPAQRIVVWDRHLDDLRRAGYFRLAERYGVRVAGSAEAGYDEKTYYETALLGKLVWGDSEFGIKAEGVGRKSFLSRLVTTQMTRIINVTPLLNHNDAGVSGNLWSLAMGSVDNTLRFESSPRRLSEAVPEIFALPSLSDRVVLNIVDALMCQYEGSETQLLQYSTELNQLWFSTDPVALDVLALRELERQRQLLSAPSGTSNRELYENAALLELGVADFSRIDSVRVP
jgi:hypothetical protein